MTFCANCGARWEEPVEFCRKCGASRIPGVVTGANVVGPVDARTISAGNSAECNTGLAPNVAAALAYLFGVVSGVVLLLLDPFRSDRFVRFHAFQSLFFAVAWIGLTIAWTVVTEIFEAVTGGFLAVLIIPLDCLLMLSGVGYWVFLMYRAYGSKRYKIPVLGQLAERQADK